MWWPDKRRFHEEGRKLMCISETICLFAVCWLVGSVVGGCLGLAAAAVVHEREKKGEN